MKTTIEAGTLAVVLSFVMTSAASAATLEGVITSYVSGNEGTDMIVRTSDGHAHRLWFDNMRKPTFDGRQLPWCPDWPCSGWPSALALNRTRVIVTVYTQRVGGATVVTPTKIQLVP